jgi:hypothetical protein
MTRRTRPTRRRWLVLGLGALIVSAASRGTASSGPVQADAQGYAGSSVGQWTCGPTARATYGGVGGHVRYYPETPDPKPEDIEPNKEAEAPELEPHGPWIGGGGGGEYRDFKRLACNETPCTNSDVVPRGLLLGAGRANVGYDWDYFGVRVGALAFQIWKNNEDRDPTAYVLPDAEFRFGRRAGFHGGLGFGAYNVSTIFRPGAYLAIGYADGRWAADLRGGLHAVFDGAIGGRVDLSGRYAVSQVVAPGLGLALNTATKVTPEASLFVVFTP